MCFSYVYIFYMSDVDDTDSRLSAGKGFHVSLLEDVCALPQNTKVSAAALCDFSAFPAW